MTDTGHTPNTTCNLCTHTGISLCQECGYHVAYIPAPDWYIGTWAGWYHINPHAEHYTRVGPR